MHIDPNRMIGSFRAVLIRDICRHSRKSQSFDVSDIADAFKLSQEAASECLKILLSEGYAESAPLTGDPLYTLTHAGLRMASASICVYKRASCERALSGLIERSKATIRDPRFLYFVTEICVFGSFLGPNETLSDVDVALTTGNSLPAPISGI